MTLKTSGGSVLRGLQPGDPPTIGTYRLVGRLGGGGMGRVFLGVSAGGRPVAVKVIRAELATDPEFRMRFGREVAAARRVSGLFTAVLVDADVDGPEPWLATAYVPGPSLSEAVEKHGPLPAGSLLSLAAGLAESLTAIHAAGVVHRDLKPSNVMLAEDGPRVIDFGISRAVESAALTQAGLVVGSPGFMSPEQAMGHEAGPSSDIFNLGGVLAFAATGEGPFGTGTTMALLYRVVHGDPSLDRVPARVRPLIESCLAKEPSQRPTADGLLAQVGALQPAADWLPESIIAAFARGAAPDLAAQAATGESQLLAPRADSSLTATSKSMPLVPENTAPGDAYRGPPPGGEHRPRRRRWRTLVLAWVIGFLVAASVAGFAVTALTGHPPAPAPSPAAQVSSRTASPPAGRTASGASSSPSSSARTSPGQSTSRPPSAPTSPSVPSSTTPTAPASATASTSASTSPSSSATASASASTSPAASASGSASSSPSSPAAGATSTSPSASSTP